MGHFFLVLALIFGAEKLCAADEYYKKGRIGEYYEYDIEGSPRRRAIHKVGFSIKSSLKGPAHAVSHGGKQSYKTVKVARDMLEQYLKGTTKNEKEAQKLGLALNDWERIMTSAPLGRQSKSPQGLLYVPYESWRLFKYSLYLVGFALPRGIKKGVKNIIINTLAGVGD